MVAAERELCTGKLNWFTQKSRTSNGSNALRWRLLGTQLVDSGGIRATGSGVKMPPQACCNQ